MGSVTQFELKAMQAHIENLREVLVSMRDLLAHEEHKLTKLARELEDKAKELGERIKDSEKLAKQVEEMEQTIGDLQEQVDAALGTEEMVEKLTTKSSVSTWRTGSRRCWRSGPTWRCSTTSKRRCRKTPGRWSWNCGRSST